MTTVDDLRRLTAHQIREVAVAAHADPRTVQRLIAGRAIRGDVAERIRRALAELRAREIAVAANNEEEGR